GIRVGHVTGVQTCALPILSRRGPRRTRGHGGRLRVPHHLYRARLPLRGAPGRPREAVSAAVRERAGLGEREAVARRRGGVSYLEIGRASCRERVEAWGVGW